VFRALNSDVGKSFSNKEEGTTENDDIKRKIKVKQAENIN
jgi:hypothetical protein